MSETASEEPTELEEVVAIGKYQLAFQLAAGGMATVYLARAEGPAGFEKLVALKRIHPHLAKQREYVEMFLDEARIASRITHNNVCSVFDFGEANGEYFIAMEYLVGVPLDRVVRTLSREKSKSTDPRFPNLVARVVADACEGLHAAHELRGRDGTLLSVVHRDVSPQNIFVTFDGTVRVVDFGIARARDKIHQTRTGEVKGKFSYMAPEQIRDDDALDRRADVWALGVILWEMLTLRRLFRRDTQSKTMYAVLESPVPTPSEIRKGIPPGLDAIVLKALSREPSDRYATARALGQDLQAFLGSTGDIFGPADLAEWLDVLFPGGEARARQLMDLARLPREPAVPNLQPTPSESKLEESVSAVRVVEQRSRRLPWIAAGAILVGAVAGGLWWTQSEEQQPEEIPSAQDVPPTPEVLVVPSPMELESRDEVEPEVEPNGVEPAMPTLEPVAVERPRMRAKRAQPTPLPPEETMEDTMRPGMNPVDLHGTPIADEVPF